MSISWSAKVSWAIENARSNPNYVEIFILLIVDCIYHLLLERNHQGKACIIENILRMVAQNIHVQGECTETTCDFVASTYRFKLHVILLILLTDLSFSEVFRASDCNTLGTYIDS